MEIELKAAITLSIGERNESSETIKGKQNPKNKRRKFNDNPKTKTENE